MIGLLTAHGEPNDGSERGDIKVLRCEFVLDTNVIGVIEFRWEAWRVRWRAGFAVAEHGHDDDMVVRERASVEVERAIDESAKASWNLAAWSAGRMVYSSM